MLNLFLGFLGNELFEDFLDLLGICLKMLAQKPHDYFRKGGFTNKFKYNVQNAQILYTFGCTTIC